jgi:hypothetical protein
MKIGDMVVHVDSPNTKGRVIAKQSKASGIVLVNWETCLKNPDSSRTHLHHWSVLTKVSDKS